MRKYSDTFVQKKIDKIDQMREDALNSDWSLPDILDREEYAWLKKKMKESIDARCKYAYIQGFWSGWTLKEGDPIE